MSATLIRFRLEFPGSAQQRFKVLVVEDGTELCHVGFLPREYAFQHRGLDGKFAQVLELYADSESPARREKSHRNHGVASFILLDDVQIQECY